MEGRYNHVFQFTVFYLSSCKLVTDWDYCYERYCISILAESRDGVTLLVTRAKVREYRGV